MVDDSGTTPEGVRIFERPTAAGFSLIIEGRPGISGANVGSSAFQQGLNAYPDLQVQVTRPLGDGSPAVCDRVPPDAGGVPAIDPPNFEETANHISIVNDLACRFLNGLGDPGGRGQLDACVLMPSGDFRFVDPTSTIQFCGFIDRVAEFPPGDTLVSARLRDTAGHVGPPASIVIRIPQ